MKVCILAAGKGTRVNYFGGSLHKGLLPLGHLAVISHIIGQFSAEARFVVALGHLAEQVRDYLSVAHPGLAVEYVQVDRHEGPGAGPGYSLWSCRHLLDEPFYLTACDTLITTAVPPLDKNFMGVQPVEDPAAWCTVDLGQSGKIERLHYKSAAGSHTGFIGFAGIVDTDLFWNGLRPRDGINGEYQVNDGFTALIESGIHAAPMGWIDTGTDHNYRIALRNFPKSYTFQDKVTDITYRAGERMIKFFPDAEVARRRYERARDNAVFARPLDHVGHFFSYRFAAGQMLSAEMDGAACRHALEWLENHFWRNTAFDKGGFSAICRQFYGEKTRKRLSLYLEKYGPATELADLTIDGRHCRSVARALDELPESFWSEGLPSTFHGDLHDDNVVVGDNGALTLIDWREDFAGVLSVGDRYYDLAKFYHTLDLSVETMEAGEYWQRQTADGVAIGHADPPGRPEAREAFRHFATAYGYDMGRIAILNGLIFINMAPLYGRNMAEYLYLLGRLRLEQALETASRSPERAGRWRRKIRGNP